MKRILATVHVSDCGESGLATFHAILPILLASKPLRRAARPPTEFPGRAARRFAQARAHDGRRRNRHERAGKGIDIHSAPAGRAGHALTKFSVLITFEGALRPIAKLRTDVRSPS